MQTQKTLAKHDEKHSNLSKELRDERTKCDDIKQELELSQRRVTELQDRFDILSAKMTQKHQYILRLEKQLREGETGRSTTSNDMSTTSEQLLVAPTRDQQQLLEVLQDKYDQTLQKLKQAEQNYTNLSTSHHEMEKDLHLKGEELVKLRSDLAEMDRGAGTAELRKHIKYLEEQIRLRDAEISTIKTEISRYKNGLDLLTLKLMKVREKAPDLVEVTEHELLEFRNELEQRRDKELEDARRKMESSKRELQHLVDGLQHKLDNSKRIIEELKERQKTVELDGLQARRELDEVKVQQIAKEQEMQSKIDQHMEKMQQYVEEMDRMRNALSQRDLIIAELRSRLEVDSSELMGSKEVKTLLADHDAQKQSLRQEAHQLREHLEICRRKNEEQQQKIGSLQRHVAQLKQAYEEDATTVESLRATNPLIEDLTDLQQERVLNFIQLLKIGEDPSSEIEILRMRLQRKDAELVALRETMDQRIKDIRAELNFKERNLVDIQKELRHKEEQIRYLQSQKDDTRAAHDVIVAADRKNETHQLTDALETAEKLKLTIKQAQKDNHELRQKIIELESESSELHTRLKWAGELEMQHNALTKQHRDAELEKDSMQKQVELHMLQIKTLKDALHNTQQLIGQKESALHRFENVMKAEQSKYKSHISRLEKEIENLHQQVSVDKDDVLSKLKVAVEQMENQPPIPPQAPPGVPMREFEQMLALKNKDYNELAKERENLEHSLKMVTEQNSQQEQIIQKLKEELLSLETQSQERIAALEIEISEAQREILQHKKEYSENALHRTIKKHLKEIAVLQDQNSKLKENIQRLTADLVKSQQAVSAKTKHNEAEEEARIKGKLREKTEAMEQTIRDLRAKCAEQVNRLREVNERLMKMEEELEQTKREISSKQNTIEHQEKSLRRYSRREKTLLRELDAYKRGDLIAVAKAQETIEHMERRINVLDMKNNSTVNTRRIEILEREKSQIAEKRNELKRRNDQLMHEISETEQRGRTERERIRKEFKEKEEELRQEYQKLLQNKEQLLDNEKSKLEKLEQLLSNTNKQLDSLAEEKREVEDRLYHEIDNLKHKLSYTNASEREAQREIKRMRQQNSGQVAPSSTINKSMKDREMHKELRERIDNLMKQLKHNNDKIDVLEQKNQDLLNIRKTMEKEIEDLREANRANQIMSRERYVQLVAVNDELKQKLHDTTELKNAIESQLNELKKNLNLDGNASNSRYMEMVKRNKTMRQKISELEEELSKHDKDQDLKNKLSRAVESNASLRVKYRKQRDEFEQIRESHLQYVEKTRSIEEENKRLQKEIEDKTQLRNDLRAARENLERKLRTVYELQDDLRGKDQEIQRLITKLGEANEARDKLQKRHEENVVQHSELRYMEQQITNLQRERDQYERQLSEYTGREELRSSSTTQLLIKIEQLVKQIEDLNIERDALRQENQALLAELDELGDDEFWNELEDQKYNNAHNACLNAKYRKILEENRIFPLPTVTEDEVMQFSSVKMKQYRGSIDGRRSMRS